MSKITVWLKDPDREYDYGVLLYNDYGDSTLLKTLFSSGKSSYHFDRLQEALKEINDQHQEVKCIQPVSIPSVEEIPVSTRRGSVSDEEWEKLPDQVKDIYTMNSRLHAHSQLLFSRMRVVDNDAARGHLALSILQDRQKLNDNWKLIKDFHAGGQLLQQQQAEEKKRIDDMSAAELTAIIRNTPSYLSKDRKRLHRLPDGPQKNKVLLRIRDRELQLEMAKKRLEEV